MWLFKQIKDHPFWTIILILIVGGLLFVVTAGTITIIVILFLIIKYSLDKRKESPRYISLTEAKEEYEGKFDPEYIEKENVLSPISSYILTIEKDYDNYSKEIGDDPNFTGKLKNYIEAKIITTKGLNISDKDKNEAIKYLEGQGEILEKARLMFFR
jgi:hypothetical protein